MIPQRMPGVDARLPLSQPQEGSYGESCCSKVLAVPVEADLPGITPPYAVPGILRSIGWAHDFTTHEKHHWSEE